MKSPTASPAKAPAMTELFDLIHGAWQRTKQGFCSLRGHHYVLQMHRRRLALHCPVCGHTTTGWDLSDPTPKPVSDRPRFLELLRKRS
jgi:hypothetical protein